MCERGCSRSTRPFAAPSSLHAQPFLSIKPIQLLVVHDHSFAFQQHADTPLSSKLRFDCRATGRVIAPDGLGVDTRCPAAHASMCERGQACTPDAARYHDPALPCVLQPVAHSVSSVLSQLVFQHNIVQHRVCQQALQFAVFIFQRFKAVGLRNVHSRDIAAPYPVVQCMPPYLALNLQNDAGLRPCLRHTSAVGIPASCSFIIPIICASVKRLFRICLLLQKVEQTLHQSEGSFGGKVNSLCGRRRCPR